MKLSTVNFGLYFASLACGQVVQQQSRPGSKLSGSSFGHPLISASYDYVIVGGGLAGLTVATRLAQNGSSVAVVEAGNFAEFSNGNWSQIPYYSTKYVGGDVDDAQPLIDWEINTVPQPQINNRVIHYAQGKCLGGSSARNQLMYHRGTKGSYDRWSTLVNDTGYAWDNMLPHFQRSAHFNPPDNVIRFANGSTSYNPAAWIPNGGPLQVTYPNYATPFSTWVSGAMQAVGMEHQVDFNSGVLNGSAYIPFTQDVHAVRSSSETSFLQLAMQTTSIKVYTNTQAQKVIFDDNKRATGVNVTVGTQSFTLNATREVILSAGVFHSPQLLMVSGIGPAASLEKHNISVLHNSSGVGQNMHDSCNVGGVTFPVSIPSMSSITDPIALAAATQEYLDTANGMLTISGSDYIGWEVLPPSYRANMTPSALAALAQWPSDWPWLEFTASSSSGTLVSSTGQATTMGVVLVAAVSRGNVTIQSDSMMDKPVVSTNWILESADQEVAIQGIRRAREIWSYMQNVTIGTEMKPGVDAQTDEEILAAIRENLSPIHHGSSTCALFSLKLRQKMNANTTLGKMGTSEDPMAVVDSHGRVFGVDALRVIDVSSFVFTPPGHTQAATYAHAEKLAADIIAGL